jgi:hypothetical protein
MKMRLKRSTLRTKCDPEGTITAPGQLEAPVNRYGNQDMSHMHTAGEEREAIKE